MLHLLWCDTIIEIYFEVYGIVIVIMNLSYCKALDAWCHSWCFVVRSWIHDVMLVKNNLPIMNLFSTMFILLPCNDYLYIYKGEAKNILVTRFF